MSVHTLNLELSALFKEVIREVWKSCSSYFTQTQWNLIRKQLAHKHIYQINLDSLYLRDLVDFVNHVEVVEYAARAKKQNVCAVVMEHLNIPSIPMNYQHFHLHVFHAKRYSITLKNQNLILRPSVTEVRGVLKQFDWPQH